MNKDYLIKKWLSDDLSEQEWEEFKQLKEYNLYMRLGNNAKNFKASEFMKAGDFKILKNRLETRPDASKNRGWHKPLLRIAAVFAITFGVYYVFFLNNQTQIEALAGEKISAVLPDSSEIVLNAVSEISYNEKEWPEKRKLTLDGEAFFKVAKGSTFDVLTSRGKVSVLGTQFNVKNRKGFFEVVCYEGRVAVKIDETSKELIPGKVLRLIDGRITTDTTKDKQPDWVANGSRFKEVPFREVILELERQYGVVINSKSIDENLLFTGGFVHNDLEEALKSVTTPLNLTYLIQSSNTIMLKNSEL